MDDDLLREWEDGIYREDQLDDDERGRRRRRTRGDSFFRDGTTAYFPSLATLRRAHSRLFQEEFCSVINRRYLGSSTNGLVTVTVRVRAIPGEQFANLKPYARRAVAALLDQFDDHSPYQVTLTANCVLQRLEETGRTSYRIYYGQSYDSQGVSNLQRSAVTQTYLMSDLGDLEQFPDFVTLDNVIHLFDLIIDDSSSSVHSIVSFVILFRRLVERTRRTLPNGSFEFSEVNESVPFVI